LKIDKHGTFIVDSPSKDGDFPKFFVCLPDGDHHGAWFMSHHQELSWLRKKSALSKQSVRSATKMLGTKQLWVLKYRGGERE